jgi:predicted Rossmann-fold nucleotide-binding protein
MGHQRNFLEALLCDAAVVFEGKEGTISEAVGTLCLGKPVLLWANGWTEDRPATYQLLKIQKHYIGCSRRKTLQRSREAI